MCRSIENPGFYQSNWNPLKIRAFYLRLTIPNAEKPLPQSLTLLYLPRINGSPLDINGSSIRSDTVAFVTLHRVSSNEGRNGDCIGEAIFASRERIRASEGVRFKVLWREGKVLKGTFRKDGDGEWKMDCKCSIGSEVVRLEVSEAEVCVSVEGHAVMNEKVEMVVSRKRTRGFTGLEEIPEEREVDDTESGGYCCCCGELEMGADGGDGKGNGEEKEEMEMKIEMEMVGVKWAVDLGIWVMCLGVGYLVSKGFRGRRFS